ncbi:MAG: DnaJ C-terminal domain-containing protein [Clostridia bacterium]|nr:DnaJ C-terminal domain-containing protein [Clostridia bacterium]
MIFKDYYKILGLETNRVNLSEIKIAFREQAKKYHPDVNGGNAKTEERFKDINEAYKVLGNSGTKRKYDRMWHTHVEKKQTKQIYEESKREKDSIFSDFFNMFFGIPTETKNEKVKKRVAIKGDNIETEINVGIEDAYFGTEKKISLRTVNGKMKTFLVKIPEGIRDGEKIRLLGQGKLGQNGGKNGDMFIKINIQNNSKFYLEGYDIKIDLYLTPWEAALGKRVSINSIDDEVSLYVPPGIQSGEKVRIPKKGYKDGMGSRGDLIAEIKTVVPKKLTQEEKELFEKLKNISKFNPREKSSHN